MYARVTISDKLSTRHKLSHCWCWYCRRRYDAV